MKLSVQVYGYFQPPRKSMCLHKTHVHIPRPLARFNFNRPRFCWHNKARLDEQTPWDELSFEKWRKIFDINSWAHGQLTFKSPEVSQTRALQKNIAHPAFCLSIPSNLWVFYVTVMSFELEKFKYYVVSVAHENFSIRFMYFLLFLEKNVSL